MRRGTVLEAAAQEGVNPATVRRKIQTDVWPCLRRGKRGPGNGAVLDLDAIRQPPRGLTPEQFAAVLRRALSEDHCDIRAGCPRDDAAAVLLIVWERYCSAVGVMFPFDAEPEPIRALKREL
jgi:hypothetical protein